MKSSGHRNQFKQDKIHANITSIFTEPKVGIGQRAILTETAGGNVLWDCITLLDQATIEFINNKGGLEAIVISHPHYYSTHLDWAQTFDCSVYIAADDQEWLSRKDESGLRKLFDDQKLTVAPGVTAIKAGGHFPGSLFLHYQKKLFIADTMAIMPSGLYHIDRPPGTTSFSFMWSYPNQITLTPEAIHGIWKSLIPFDFDETYGAFYGAVIRSKEVKKRVLESMKIQARAMGHTQHALFDETYQ